MSRFILEVLYQMEKRAGQAAPPQGQPSPFGGPNPVQIKQQQQAAAAAGSATPAGNPDVLKAQEGAMQQQQAAQEEVMKSQQAAQQQIQQAQQQSQQQMEEQQKSINRLQEELSIANLQVEKEKAKAELSKEQADLVSKTQDIMANQEQPVAHGHARVSAIGERIQKAMAKIAATAQSTATQPNSGQYLQDHLGEQAKSYGTPGQPGYQPGRLNATPVSRFSNKWIEAVDPWIRSFAVPELDYSQHHQMPDADNQGMLGNPMLQPGPLAPQSVMGQLSSLMQTPVQEHPMLAGVAQQFNQGGFNPANQF